MTILYKLTNPDDTTKGGMKWENGIEHTAPGAGKLCTAAWLHAYRDPLLAVFMAPAHGAFGRNANIWECDGDVGIDDGTKVGCSRIRTLQRIDLPTVTIEQRVMFAIQCARRVYSNPIWTSWADRWESGFDRTAATARTVETAAKSAPTRIAARAAGVMAARAAASAAESVAATSEAAATAWAARTAEAAAWAARAAESEVRAAGAEGIDDLISIVHDVCDVKPDAAGKPAAR